MSELQQFNPTLFKGSPSSVGLPLNIIKDTTNRIYSRYTENRAKAFQLQSSALNLPDIGNENNRKLIQDLGTSIDSKFKEYQDEDKWWEADKAVMQVAKELSTSQIVKDLQTHAALKAKVDKDIDDSKAPEYYKNLQRLYNQKTYKGIRDEKGNALNYSGTSLSSCDLMSKYKEYQELAKGFEADMNTYMNNPSQTVIDNASDGFKYAVNHFGTTKIKQVSKDEVKDYLMSIISNDPEFNAITQDVARLDLFARKISKNPNETNFSATVDDVKELYNQKASENPLLAKLAIISSPNYIEATKGMKDKEKDAVLNKILADKNAYAQYYREGLDAEFSKTTASPDMLYYNMYRNDAFRVIDGMANKYSYKQVDMDIKSIVDPTTSERFKELLKQNQGVSDVITPTNTVNIPNMSAHIELRDSILNEMDKVKAIISDNTVSESVKSQKRFELDMLQGKLNANDLVLRGIKDSLGKTDFDILNMSKDKLINIARTYINPTLSTSAYTYTKEKPEIISDKDIIAISNIISKNIDKSNNEISNEIYQKVGKNINQSNISILRSKYSEELKHNTDLLLKQSGQDHIAINVHAVGSMGVDKSFYSNSMSLASNMFAQGNGDFEMVTVPSIDLFKNVKPGSPNAGIQHIYSPNSKAKNAGTNPIKMDLAFAANDDVTSADGLLLKVEETLDSGQKANYLVRYKGNSDWAKQIMYNVLERNTKNANNINSPSKILSTQTAKSIANYIGSSLPVTRIVNPINEKDTRNITNSTLGYTLNNIKLIDHNGTYETVESSITLSNGQQLPIIIKTSEDNGLFDQQVYNAVTKQKIAENINGRTPSAILEAIGSRKVILDYTPQSEMGQQLMKLFNVQFDGTN